VVPYMVILDDEGMVVKTGYAGDDELKVLMRSCEWYHNHHSYNVITL